MKKSVNFLRRSGRGKICFMDYFMLSQENEKKLYHVPSTFSYAKMFQTAYFDI